MSRVVYNRGRPNRRFGSTSSISLGVGNFRISEFFTSFGISSDTKNLIMIDTPSLGKATPSGNSNISLGINCGTGEQGDNCISIGANVGSRFQYSRAIGIGSNAGCNHQSNDSVSIGTFAGSFSQGIASISVGSNAGKSKQNNNSIAIGTNAGQNCQGANCISIGSNAGSIEANPFSIAIGTNAGQNCQGAYCISIGTDAGSIEANPYSIAIGSNVGVNRLGENSIVIGKNIKCTQANTVVINTDSTEMFQPKLQGFFMKNIITQKRAGGDFRALRFNPNTSQIVYDYNSGAGAFGTDIIGPLNSKTSIENRKVVVSYEDGSSAISFEILAFSIDGGFTEEIKFLVDIASGTTNENYIPHYYHNPNNNIVTVLDVKEGIDDSIIVTLESEATELNSVNCYLSWTIY